MGRARNCGIDNSTGTVLIFTDDDCYFAENFLDRFDEVIEPSKCQYGGGQIILYDAADDPRCANLRFTKDFVIPPDRILPSGLVQGANMFFFRDVFDKVGMFNEDMGAGTSFACEDIEMACRASRGGFVGYMTPDLKVFHHHGRKLNSKEAIETMMSYEYGRGAYYASLILENVQGAWSFWETRHRMDVESKGMKIRLNLAREMMGAAKYIEYLYNKENRKD